MATLHLSAERATMPAGAVTLVDAGDRRAPRPIRRSAFALVALALAASGAACATSGAGADASASADPAPCAAPRVVVRNDTRAPVDVYAERGGRRELLATVSPGRTELPIDAADQRFVAFPTGADATRHGYADPVSFTIVCPTRAGAR